MATKQHVLKVLKKVYAEKRAVLQRDSRRPIASAMKQRAKARRFVERGMEKSWAAWMKACPVHMAKTCYWRRMPCIWDRSMGVSIQTKDWPEVAKIEASITRLHRANGDALQTLRERYEKLERKVLLMGISPELLQAIEKFIG